MKKEHKTLIYHNTEAEAKRSFKPLPEQNVTYRGIDQWNESDHDDFNVVHDLSDKPVETAESVDDK